MNELTNEDLNLIRQWFNALEDCSPEYLCGEDYELAKRIYVALGVKIPKSIERGNANVTSHN